MKILAILAAAVLANAVPALAQETSSGSQTSDASAAVTTPQQFSQVAGGANMFEIESSKLALQSGSAASVKQFAQQMIDDHTKAGTEMQAAAQEESAPVPTAMDQKHQMKLDQLKSAEGESFDKAYVTEQVAAHEEAVALFTSYSKNGPPGALRDFAAKTLPTLQKHLEEIKKLAGT